MKIVGIERQCVVSRSLGRIRRSQEGNQIAELGPTLWIVFIMLLFPLVAFSTIGIRYVFFANAARTAASIGAQCSTFQTDANPPSDCSAVNTATKVANQAISGFTGVTLTGVDCYIVTCPLSGGTPSRRTAPLAVSADTNTNSYDFEVVLRGQVSPLIAGSNWSLRIPGLSAPISTTARAAAFFENTQGLIQ